MHNGNNSRLPPPPALSSEAGTAPAAREALAGLLSADRRLFFDLFFVPASAGLHGGQAGAGAAHLATLERLGLLATDEAGRWHAPYLISPWQGDFYITDFPHTGHAQEVYSPHLQTRQLATMLQSRADDQVLDLGTGSGILLLEAARRGAAGLGIDRNPRALDFARANAALNHLSGQARFARSDFTSADATDQWGQPTVILGSPPFDPAGPDDGTAPLRQMVETLAQWDHRPALIQLVLLSPGKPGAAEDGQHLLVMPLLEQASARLSATLELHEFSRPLGLLHFAVHAQQGVTDQQRGAWVEGLRGQGYHDLHLFVATFYHHQTRRHATRWTSHADNRQNDECFIRPLAASDREVSEALFEKFVDHGQPTEKGAQSDLDLELQRASTQQVLCAGLRHETLFGDAAALLVLDLWRGDAATAEGHLLELTTDGRVLGHAPRAATLVERLADLGPWPVAVVLRPERGRLRVCQELAQEPAALAGALLTLTDQQPHRVAVACRAEALLSPPRQRILALLLSEIARRNAWGQLQRREIYALVAHDLCHDIYEAEAAFEVGQARALLAGELEPSVRQALYGALAQHRSVVSMLAAPWLAREREHHRVQLSWSHEPASPADARVWQQSLALDGALMLRARLRRVPADEAALCCIRYRFSAPTLIEGEHAEVISGDAALEPLIDRVEDAEEELALITGRSAAWPLDPALTIGDMAFGGQQAVLLWPVHELLRNAISYLSRVSGSEVITADTGQIGLSVELNAESCRFSGEVTNHCFASHRFRGIKPRMMERMRRLVADLELQIDQQPDRVVTSFSFTLRQSEGGSR